MPLCENSKLSCWSETQYGIIFRLWSDFWKETDSWSDFEYQNQVQNHGKIVQTQENKGKLDDDEIERDDFIFKLTSYGVLIAFQWNHNFVCISVVTISSVS